MSTLRTRRRPATLRRTIVALLVSILAVLCLAIGAITHLSMRAQLSEQLDQQLTRAAERAGTAQPTGQDGAAGQPERPGQLPSSGSGSPADEDGPGPGEFELTAIVDGGRVTDATYRDASGAAVPVPDADDLAEALDHADRHHSTDVDLEGLGGYRITTSRAPDGTEVVTGLPLAPMRATLARLDLTLALASLLALLVAAVAGSAVVRRTLAPLEGVARVASDVASMPLDSGSVVLAERAPPVTGRSGREVDDVSRALNRLLDNVEGALEVRQASEERMRRFIADASHELRTPLTSIRGYTEMLRLTEDLTERGAQSVDRLDAQSRRMTSLVEDLLLLARLDEGAPRADGEVDLGEIVVESVLDAQVTAPGHRWELEVPDDPQPVLGDERQLAQVVVNLVSNARKHTPEGTTVHVALAREGGDVVLRVADDGPGIDPELAGEVFTRFTRADRARSGEERTTGLGLPIVRAIAEAHGGTIGVESRPGRTVFEVRLPAAG